MSSVADFVPQRHLGSGASGVVRLARRIADGRLYALKELQMPRNPNEASAMLQESHILASIEHPFVIRYYDSFVDNSSLTLYLVMEYAPNGSLHGLLEEHQRTGTHLDETVIWRYCIQLFIGLHAIHSLRVVHRDIKPHNIFLGEGDIVKIGDFGVSRQLNSSREMAQTLVGSPGYLSPELCNGDPYNEKADIWALGVLLSELCALKHPFGDASSQAALIMKIMRAAPPMLPSMYSAQLSRLLVCCMQRQPLSRPSALQLLSLSTTLQHAARLDLLSYFPPSALRTYAASASGKQATVTSFRVDEGLEPQLDADAMGATTSHSHLRGTFTDETFAEERHHTHHNDVADSGVGRRQGERRRCGNSTRKASSGPWELKPVCVGRQRCGSFNNTNSHGTYSSAESSAYAFTDDDNLSGEELGPSTSTPPRPVAMGRAQESAWGWGRGASSSDLMSEEPVRDRGRGALWESGSGLKQLDRRDQAHPRVCSSAFLSAGSVASRLGHVVSGEDFNPSASSMARSTGGRAQYSALERDGVQKAEARAMGLGRGAGAVSSEPDKGIAFADGACKHSNRRDLARPRVCTSPFPTQAAASLPVQAPVDSSIESAGNSRSLLPSASSPREREVKGLWAKRRGDAHQPMVAGKLHMLSLNDGDLDHASSPIDRFARHHCPDVARVRGDSCPSDDGLYVPVQRPEASPLYNLVRQNFPRRNDRQGVGGPHPGCDPEPKQVHSQDALWGRKLFDASSANG